MICVVFFFNDTATTEIYTLSLHDALPIWLAVPHADRLAAMLSLAGRALVFVPSRLARHKRSEEHTSELQSRQYLVCRLLLEKKKNKTSYSCITHLLIRYLLLSTLHQQCTL